MKSNTVSPQFLPLIGLIESELRAIGSPTDAANIHSMKGFAQWYLDATRRLSDACTHDQSPAVSRREIELMCRTGLGATSLGHAVKLISSYCDLLAPRGGKIELQVRGDRALLTLDSLRGAKTSTSTLVDVTGLYSFYQLFRWLIGRHIPISKVLLAGIDRSFTFPFLALFDAPLIATRANYAFEFPAHFLQLPIQRTPYEFDEFFELYPCNVFERNQTPLARQIEAMFLAQFRVGGKPATQQEIANVFGMSTSTLKRELRRGGSSFIDIRHQARLESAKHLLEQTHRKTGDIANSLGFSEVATFARYFTKMTGQTPDQWRREKQGATR